MTDLKLSAPWVTFYREVEALFGDDPEVNVVYNEDDLNLKLYVDNQAKADAIAKLLPTEKVFGNVVLMIDVIPSNLEESSKMKLLKTAFEGNPAFSYAITVGGISTNEFNFVVFKNKVVQFYNDQLDDVNGNLSTLYENIARDVLGSGEGVYYCTDLPEDLEESRG